MSRDSFMHSADAYECRKRFARLVSRFLAPPFAESEVTEPDVTGAKEIEPRSGGTST
jgi:hypothetical protein